MRLRARLSEYYIKEGNADALVIELPKGGYVPRFHEVEEERQVTVPIPEETPARLGTRFWVAFGFAGLVIGMAAAGWWWIQHRSAPIPIAVLPLENTSHDAANDYFADGLTDELIRNLSIIDGLAVRSRSPLAYRSVEPSRCDSSASDRRACWVKEGSLPV